jgi:hypothetical protein
MTLAAAIAVCDGGETTAPNWISQAQETNATTQAGSHTLNIQTVVHIDIPIVLSQDASQGEQLNDLVESSLMHLLGVLGFAEGEGHLYKNKRFNGQVFMYKSNGAYSLVVFGRPIKGDDFQECIPVILTRVVDLKTDDMKKASETLDAMNEMISKVYLESPIRPNHMKVRRPVPIQFASGAGGIYRTRSLWNSADGKVVSYNSDGIGLTEPPK